MSEFEMAYFPWDCILIKCMSNEDLNAPIPKDTCFRLILISSGAGILKINDKPLAFTAPTFICQNERETIELISSNDIFADSFHFHPTWVNPDFTYDYLHSFDWRENKELNFQERQDRYFLAPFVDRNDSYLGLINTTPETFSTIRKIFDATQNQLDNHPDFYWPCRSRSYLIQALIQVADLLISKGLKEGKPDFTLKTKEDPIINGVIAYLHNHYSEEIDIQNLEQAFAINRTTLAEKFKEITGQPVMTYLRNIRLRTAASLLQETGIPISEVCSRVGFNDLSHFGRSFREAFQLTPTEYRDQYCWVFKQ